MIKAIATLVIVMASIVFAIISSIEFNIITKYDKYDDVRQFKLDQDAS
jgi:hypothetical protein